eukprot:766394-Hanusia_phi.AAC.4
MSLCTETRGWAQAPDAPTMRPAPRQPACRSALSRTRTARLGRAPPRRRRAALGSESHRLGPRWRRTCARRRWLWRRSRRRSKPAREKRTTLSVVVVKPSETTPVWTVWNHQDDKKFTTLDPLMPSNRTSSSCCVAPRVLVTLTSAVPGSPRQNGTTQSSFLRETKRASPTEL